MHIKKYRLILFIIISPNGGKQGQDREQKDDGDISDYLRLRDAFCVAVRELK